MISFIDALQAFVESGYDTEAFEIFVDAADLRGDDQKTQQVYDMITEFLVGWFMERL